MGNRDYYFNTDKETVTIRTEYVKHLEAMSKLMGNNEAISKKNAQVIMKLETELAKNSRKIEALRDPIMNYNKIPFNKLKADTPNIEWKSLLHGLGIKKADSVIVGAT